MTNQKDMNNTETVTVSSQRFKELEELERSLIEDKGENAFIIYDYDRDNHCNMIVRVLRGSEALDKLIEVVQQQSKDLGMMEAEYVQLQKVTPLKYLRRAGL